MFLFPLKLSGSAFHCPYYIKKLSHEKHLASLNKPSYSSSAPATIKSKEEFEILSPSRQLKRWAEHHYKDLASDTNRHSVDREYWNRVLRFTNLNQTSWDINGPITIEEIKNVISTMNNNKVPEPFFSTPELLEESFPAPGKCLDIIFNKIWNGSFPRNWNTASIVSIPKKKGDLSDCNNYRGISLINVGLKILSKVVTERISNEYLRHNPTMSTYVISRDLEIPPIAGTCAPLQVKCFVKWRKSNCIIKDLIKYIPSLSHHSWTKESNILRNKLRKANCKDVSHGWIIRLRCGFSYNTIIAIRSGRVTNDCPRMCSCCGQGEQSFDHYVIL
ncbi:hypothetical protein PIROE2DRAFT_6805 [Piromyces sp. E2]|nr:hypothetical protein PIROE2DRAFT_6805 [Piromyces sp. E2]|eukprot:OUM66093.1 hypothetical protein PIROE2DRAFT_6805 [Piromyces sp. E2]